jgi:hypothetical protein
MLISELRSLDQERYEEHIQFVNEISEYIQKISTDLEENFGKIQELLFNLNMTVKNSLDSLLSGINPEGLKQTSGTLKEIMNTMSRSIQSLNLDTVMRELRGIAGTGIQLPAEDYGGSSGGHYGSGAPSLAAGMDTPYSSSGMPQENEEPEIYGYVPDSMKKKKKGGNELIKPSSLRF